MTAAAVPLRDPAWPGRAIAASVLLALLLPAGYLAEFNPAVFFTPGNFRSISQFLATFIPPAHSPEFLLLVLVSAWKTIAIATVGTALAMMIAVPLALLGNRRLSVSALADQGMAAVPAVLRSTVRGLLIFLRSIPEIVWALLIVRAVGLGDTAGVLAIGLTYGGMLGKVYIEIFESSEVEATRALLRNGASRRQAFLYGMLPVCLGELTSYTVYRWECAIRASVIMGFVGAGGLGQQMELSMRMLAGGEVLSMLLVFSLLVWVADQVSLLLRRWAG